MDSYDLHLRCWLATLRKFNVVSNESNIMKHFGKSHIDMVYALLPAIDNKLAADIALTEKELFKKSERDLQLFPGVMDTLSEVNRRGFLCAIASSNARDDTMEMVERLGISQYVSVITGADEVSRGKPQPDLFALAARRLAIEPATALVVGDTRYDVAAGNKAGMRTALLVGKETVHMLRQFLFQDSADYLIPEIKYLTIVLGME